MDCVWTVRLLRVSCVFSWDIYFYSTCIFGESSSFAQSLHYCDVFITEVAGQYQRAILLNNGTHLCLLDIRILSDHHDHKVQCFYQHTEANETITYMDVNMKSREVYFTAGKSIYRVRIDTGSNAITASQLLSTPDRKNRQFTGTIVMLVLS